MGKIWNGQKISSIPNSAFAIMAFLLFASVCLWQPSLVHGKERVEMSVNAGFGGEMKQGDWVPLRVTLTNNGSAVEGKVYVQFDDSGGYTEWTGTVEERVELPQGATKELTLIVPGDRLSGNQKVVFAVDGKKVADTRISGSWKAADEMTIGVLSTSPDAGKFLSGLGRNGGNHRMPAINDLKPEDIPEVGIALSGLNVLVLNNFPAETLNANQTEAIKRWVSSGGTLILGGGPEYQKTAQAFQELSPVEVSGTDNISGIETLQGQKKHGAELKFKSPLTISEGKLKPEATALVEQNGAPIIASMPWQEGEVIFTAYNLATAPLNDWEGNAVLWGNILGGSGTSVIHSVDFPWSLMQSVDYIPSLKLPSVGILAVAFLLYVLLVGPVLYLILRKFDKRGWAWGIIPLSAVIVALGVYAYGADDRGNEVMVHNVNVLKLYPNEFAELRGATGVFVPDGGTYELNLPETVTGWPAQSSFDAVSPTDWSNYRVSMTPDGTDIAFEDVEFWSLRKAYVEGQVKVGKIVSDLTSEGNRVVGTVTNESQLDLTDVYVLSGGGKHAVGTLKAGETKKVDIKLGSVSAQGPGYYQLLPATSGPMTGEFQRRELLLQYLDHEAYRFRPFQSQVQLVGWTEQPVYETTVRGKSSDQYSLSLVITPLTVKAGANGEVVWPKGTIIPEVVETSGSVEVMPNEFMMPPGTHSMTFRFDLNTTEPIKLKKLAVDLANASLKNEWLNWTTGEWEEANTGKSLNDYLSKTGEVLVRISQESGGSEQYYQFPTLEAEGEVVR